MTSLFQRNLVPLRKKRCAKNFQKYAFLHEHTEKMILERLEEITHKFPVTAFYGATPEKEILKKLENTGGIQFLCCGDYINSIPLRSHPFSCLQYDEEALPFAHQSLDLLISNLSLHQTNDLPGALIQIRRALKPDGLFVGALFGGETLWQLRQSLNYAEEKLKRGQSPRVHPFADKQQMGALMQRAGYALPVVDSELVTVTYPNIFKLMVDLRGMGETNMIAARSRHNPGKEFFHVAGQYYAQNFSDQNQRIEATFEIIFVIGWAPHSSQQQPLRPGSAKIRLAEALDTTEISTGEKTGL